MKTGAAALALAIALAGAPALADSAAERFQKASELIQQKKHAEAKKELEEAIKLDPKHVDARRVLGALLKAEGKAEAAAKHLAVAIEEQPGDIKLMSELANMYADVAVQAARGAALTKKRDEFAAKALELYKKVYEADPVFVVALYNIGTMHALREEWKDAATALEKYVAEKPEDLRGHFNYAQSLDKGGLGTDKAIAAWEAYLARAKDDARAKKSDVALAEERIKALRKKG